MTCMTPRFCSAAIMGLLPPASAIASVPVIPPESQSSALASANMAVPLGLSASLLGGVDQPRLNHVHTTHMQQHAKQLSPTDSQALLILRATPNQAGVEDSVGTIC